MMYKQENVRIVIEDGVIVESQGGTSDIVKNLAVVLGFLVAKKRKPECTPEDTVNAIKDDILQMVRLVDAARGLQCEVTENEHY